MKETICGIDEAGRGPIAGPVTAAAVILPADFPNEILQDSKKIAPGRRSEIASIIMEKAADFGVGWCWPFEIDTINIHYATLLAMERSLRLLSLKPDKIFIDGLYCPASLCPSEAVVGGDTKVASIMAASILAKTARDRWMIRYSWLDKRYLFEKHKGYPTAQHRELCRKHGLSPIHRRSFHFE